MAGVGMQQVTYFPRDMSPPFIPHQPQNFQVLPITPANDGQLEDHLHIDMPQPVGDVITPGRLHDPHHIDMVYRGVVGYHPLPQRYEIGPGPCRPIYVPRYRTRPRYQSTSTTQFSR